MIDIEIEWEDDEGWVSNDLECDLCGFVGTYVYNEDYYGTSEGAHLTCQYCKIECFHKITNG